jgi:hypothetical protein
MNHSKGLVVATLAITALLSLPTLVAAAEPGVGQNETSSQTRVARTKALTQKVARGLALAMENREIRTQIRDTMRHSPWNEHRIALQEFVTTPQGRKVVLMAAKSLGLSPEDFKSTVASLPQLDFYVPFVQHRTTWKATPELLVAASFERHAPQLTAYDVTGNPHSLLLVDGVPGYPLFILSPASKKRPLLDRLVTTGDVIQDARKSVSAKMVASCDGSQTEISCDGGGGGGTTTQSSSPGYYLTYFDIKGDDGWFDNSLEVQFRSFYRASNGNIYQARTLAVDGVSGDLGYNVNLFLNSYRDYTTTPTDAVFVVTIWEMDGGPNSLNPDDYYGERQYPGGPINGVTYTYSVDGTTTGYIQMTAR